MVWLVVRVVGWWIMCQWLDQRIHHTKTQWFQEPSVTTIINTSLLPLNMVRVWLILMLQVNIWLNTLSLMVDLYDPYINKSPFSWWTFIVGEYNIWFPIWSIYGPYMDESIIFAPILCCLPSWQSWPPTVGVVHLFSCDSCHVSSLLPKYQHWNR